MKRREFILGSAAAAWPLAARGEKQNKPIIGYLSSRSSDAEGQHKDAFLRGLQEAGYVEGNDITIEYRFSSGQENRLSALATDLIHRHAAVIVATDGPSAQAAKRTTHSIPIVFSAGGDPVKLGLVDTLNRPSGNATGIHVFISELGPKRLQLLRQLIPHAKLIAFIVNLSAGSGALQAQAMQSAAQAMGQEMLTLNAATESQIDDAFATLVARKADAIIYSANPFFQVIRDKLVTLAARFSVPAVYEWPEFVRAGGLMSYSSNRSEAGLQVGRYTGQILKGAKPADLPVVQSSTFELAMNLKTANALGLTIPPSILAIADEVIE